MTALGFPAFTARPGRRGRSWWAREFVSALEDAALDAGVLRRGRRFAGSGRLGPVTVAPGQVSAVADDPDDGLVRTVVHLAELDDAGWQRLLDQVAAESGHLAALLDGEVPRTLADAADAAGVALLPGVGDLESDCDCSEVGDPCVHSAALAYQTAWLLDDDPFLLLLLRGRSADELLTTLGTSGSEPSTVAAAHEEIDRPVPRGEAGAPRPLPPAVPVPAGPAPPLRVPPAPHTADRDALARLAAAAAQRAREMLRS